MEIFWWMIIKTFIENFFCYGNFQVDTNESEKSFLLKLKWKTFLWTFSGGYKKNLNRNY